MLASVNMSNGSIYQYITTTTPIMSTYVIGIDGNIGKQWSAAVNIQQSNVTTVPTTSVIPNVDAPIIVTTETVGATSNSLNVRLTGVNVLAKTVQSIC